MHVTMERRVVTTARKTGREGGRGGVRTLLHYDHERVLLTEDTHNGPECLVIDEDLLQTLALQIVFEAVSELCMLQRNSKGRGEGRGGRL